MSRVRARPTAALVSVVAQAAFVALIFPSSILAQAETMSIDDFDRLMLEVSNAGRWGPGDVLGTLNLITPEVRTAAAREVREGLTVSMSVTLEPKEGPNAGAPPQLDFDVIDSGGEAGWAVDALTIPYHGHSLSHLDGLGHAHYRGRLYNGFPRDEPGASGVQRLGVESMRDGIVSRGVLVDLPRTLGIPFLEPGTFITAADLEAWERATGVRVGQGDVVLIRTGRLARVAAEGDWRLAETAAGPHPSLARWLRERGVAVLGGDNNNERYPSIVSPLSTFHLLALVGMGMPLLDNLDLERVGAEAAVRGRQTFLFVAAPLPVVGGTGSPLNPLAIF